MALKNRTEVKAVINNWAATLDLEATHKPDLQDNFIDNCVLRKDISAIDTAAGATKTLDFLDIDYITVTQSTNVTYTLSNVQQGEIKYLKITKSTGQTIAFTAAIDTSIDQRTAGLISTATEILYRIINKDGTSIFVEPIIKQLDIGEWQTPSYNANFSAGTNPLEYRLTYGRLEFRGEMDTTVTSGVAFVLPAAYRPATDQQVNYVAIGAAILSTNIVRVEANGNVDNISTNGWAITGDSASNAFNNIIILD